MIAYLIEKKKIYGLTGLCFGYFFSKLLLKFHIIFLVRHVFYKPTEYCTSKRSDYIAKEISYEQLKEQFSRNRTWFTPAKIKSLVFSEKNGDKIIGIYDDNLLIAYGMVSFSTIYLKNIKLKITDSYLYDSYVHPDYRGMRLHEEINRGRLNLSVHKEKQRAITTADWYNRASIRAKKREGFIRKETYLFLKIKRVRVCTFKYKD